MTRPLPAGVRTAALEQLAPPASADVLRHLATGLVPPASADVAPHAVGERIPTVCHIADVLRILNMSRDVFFKLRRAGTFPIPEMTPALDAHPRFRGTDLQHYIDGRLAGGRAPRHRSR